MRFTYKARDPLGNHSEGSLESPDKDAARDQLRRDGFAILALDEVEETPTLFSPPVRSADIIYTTSQLAVLVDTGITLSAALNSIAEQEPNVTLRGILRDLKTRVEGGEDFSTALGRYPKYFDRTYLALIKASEHTGTLAEMLESIANYQRGQLETRHKVRAALTYPAVMLVLAIGVTVFLLTYILPKFAPMFARKGVKLPMVTQWMIAASDSMLHYWYAWAAGFVAAIVLYIVSRRTEAGRKVWDWIMLNLPVIGATYRKVVLSRSVRTLGTMVKSGVSMLDAVQMTGQVAGNFYYEQAWVKVLDQITQGNRICDGLKGNGLFPPTLLQMIGAGEETAKLDHVLEKVSNYYDREVENAIKSTTSMIEPILIVIMGGVVATIAMGLLLPIFSLSRAG
jgi:type IV pilus assembly protein PilC